MISLTFSLTLSSAGISAQTAPAIIPPSIIVGIIVQAEPSQPVRAMKVAAKAPM